MSIFAKKKEFSLILLLFILDSIWARDVTISVEDKDLQLPLGGAVIRSWDSKDYVCDEDGKALVTVPDDRQVSIQVTYPGYETGRMVIPIRGENFSIGLGLKWIIEGKELVIEAARTDSSETKSGRSVAISGEALEQSSQIGFVEDVMTSIKLLPGVGYTGFFNAMPSIRGGDPGDLKAVLDGFYIDHPYYWGGGFSIFDPHMVESAQLSHGIYSARYGYSISGLLEVNSKKAPVDHAELELGISSSAVNLNASVPIGKKGGFILMGKITYWDPFIWAEQQLSKSIENEALDMINSVYTAPYIRSAAASFNYRFNNDLELQTNVFLGTDGVGFDYTENYSEDGLEYRSRTIFDWQNINSFFTTGLSWSPRSNMVLKTRVGAGYQKAKMEAVIATNYLRVNSGSISYELDGNYLDMDQADTYGIANLQGRLDFDMSLGKGFLVALGAQEMFSDWSYTDDLNFFMEAEYISSSGEKYYGQFPVRHEMSIKGKQRFLSSAYVLGEYTSPGNRFGSELGLRVDHLHFRGKDFSLRTRPVFNPRLNLDFNLYRGGELFQSLDLTVGSGLFSSTNMEVIPFASKDIAEDYEIKPNRSWTSVLGVKTELSNNWIFNIEGFYKYVFDRMYNYEQIENNKLTYVGRFDGDGIVWGFDLMLQKFESRYWDGWLSYTFTHARYHENERLAKDLATIEDSGWYYPDFHRFHNLNLVLNFKPFARFNIYTRLGLASGLPKPVVGEITEYTVMAEDANSNSKLIKKYYRDSEYSDSSRSSWSIPWDLKFSYFFFNPRNRVQTELYLAIENLLSLVYTPQANTTFNPYTGKEDKGSSDSADFSLPIPMLSVGAKWSY